MTEKDNNSIITSLLLKWYGEKGRDLPWRETTDPYKIWISEIILQQTRVVQGRDYYFRFIGRFPNVESLAVAEEDEVLKLWQGLGYYTRARNVHAAAKQVMTTFNGIFPSTYPDIISLRGVGEYTAAAIASIAFNEPYAVVDGNVFRVISRLFGIALSIHTSEGKKIIREMAQSLLDPQDPGKYNQAVMDFGALVCTPAQPRCIDCVLQDYCTALAENRVGELPVNDRKIFIRNRYFHYFHIQHNDNTFLQKRNGSDIWKNLFEFPLIETPTPFDFTELEKTEPFRELFNGTSSLSVDHRLTIKHQLTHQTIHTHFYRIIIPGEIPYNPPKEIFKIENEQLPDYPVSRLTHKYLEII
ncbi:A/G-specific adenine glycosylase [Proteiniphilum acetatigenes]|uniref:A/G-specific adenine glycosylase n=1 Tax=Proteiniphilum acetatigenes TaxID=294710 RepID=UPI00035F645D|nr:A/G-specific adenine glycosylase [Proteiniphilum acetatigenes]SFK87534.1 A/G-specific DNA-adenine glycosylase [Porphyromonadaceae bacterium KH3CP3RA]